MMIMEEYTWKGYIKDEIKKITKRDIFNTFFYFVYCVVALFAFIFLFVLLHDVFIFLLQWYDVSLSSSSWFVYIVGLSGFTFYIYMSMCRAFMMLHDRYMYMFDKARKERKKRNLELIRRHE